MTDSELNELVARKLGWVPAPDKIDIFERHWINTTTKRLVEVSELPDYVHSIEAAWEIVEARKNYRRDIVIMGSYERDGYCCRLADMIDGKLVVSEGHGDTAPRAICEAFLKLK